MRLNQQRTGQVFVKNFDTGVVETLGAELRIVKDPDGLERKGYYLDITGVGKDLPVYFSQPEVEFGKFKLPCIVVVRDEPAFAANRWPSVNQAYEQQVGPVVTIRGVTGRTGKESQEGAWPYDITYTIEGLVRLKGQAIHLLNYVLRVYKPYGSVYIVDSLGESRSYEAFVEGVSNLDEVADVTERVAGFGVTLRVEAELDLSDPYVTPVATSIQLNVERV